MFDSEQHPSATYTRKLLANARHFGKFTLCNELENRIQNGAQDWNVQPRSMIFIKTLTGRKQAFNFEPENQVLAVKQALQEKEGIQVDQIKLIFSGKQLADNNTLESYNIAAGATIHMVLQLRGGF